MHSITQGAVQGGQGVMETERWWDLGHMPLLRSTGAMLCRAQAKAGSNHKEQGLSKLPGTLT